MSSVPRKVPRWYLQGLLGFPLTYQAIFTPYPDRHAARFPLGYSHIDGIEVSRSAPKPVPYGIHRFFSSVFHIGAGVAVPVF
jgi:hypothetical protein